MRSLVLERKQMIDGNQIRIARVILRMGVRELAHVARVSPATVTRIETGSPANSSTLAAIQHVFEAGDVQFVRGAARGGLQAQVLQAVCDIADVSADHPGLIRTVDGAIQEAIDDFLKAAAAKGVGHDIADQVEQVVKMLEMKIRWSSESRATLAKDHYEKAIKYLRQKSKKAKRSTGR
jgi:hypothetical protein